ncbi:MAG: helicase-related protein [Candidatus Sifarchaeia archaeon]
MSETRPPYTPRGYQTYILDRISEAKGTNFLLELDCGLGKRFLTHQLVAERFGDLKFIILVHSSSSLAETLDYLKSEYGGLDEDLGELSSRVPSRRRPAVLRESRVVVATPQVLASLAQKDVSLFEPYDAVLINEVDTLVRRSGTQTSLVFPWSTILSHFADKWLIGMSGTLRDDHAVFTKEQLEIREELNTLKEHIPNAEIISMEDLYGTDVEDYLEPTFLKIVNVSDVRLRSTSLVLDELVRNTRSEIMTQLAEDDNLDLIEGDARRVHLLLERLPVDEELKGRYSGLLMLRKYVYAMPRKQFLKMFQTDYLKHYFDIGQLRRSLPSIPSKITRVLEVALRYNKTLVLTSYLEMVKIISDVLTKAGLQVLVITGQTRDKGGVLREFRKNEEARVLVMSPVGERDLDIPQADAMVVCDTINTTKTMYQKMKRTRGGLVVLLAYEGTSEERKVRRLMQRVLERYPWSTAVLEPEASF